MLPIGRIPLRVEMREEDLDDPLPWREDGGGTLANVAADHFTTESQL
jgi:hypothetical protein